jgi:hypothetical protein
VDFRTTLFGRAAAPALVDTAFTKLMRGRLTAPAPATNCFCVKDDEFDDIVGRLVVIYQTSFCPR